MKVSFNWLKELVDLKISNEALVNLLSLKTIGTKESTPLFVELDMKGYNRADLLSLRGVAYEVAAITHSKLLFSEADLLLPHNLPTTQVDVVDKNLCPIYCIAKIEGLEVAKSPPTWLKKLTSSGFRSINNIADVTNLVMLEFGQPLHAFDANKVKDQTLVVRTAKDKESLTTLDGKQRRLSSSDLLIADPEKILGLAGIIGGKTSEVSDQTSTILLEAAIFDGKNLRRSAQRLGITSEAAKRFQHGLTQKRLFQALGTAIKLYQNLGGKITALTIVGDYQDREKHIVLDLQKVSSLIGIELHRLKIQDFLTRLGFIISSSKGKIKNNHQMTVRPPYWRLDIEIAEDVIEEVARMYGYEKIHPQPLPGKPPEKIDQTFFEKIKDIKNKLVELGLTEVQTYSFVSSRLISLNFQSKKDSIKIANPISSETEYLRQWLSPNLLEVAGKNLKKFPEYFKDGILIFEIGKCYYPPKNGLLSEPYKLAILASGDHKVVPSVYKIFKELIDSLKMAGVEVKPSKPPQELVNLFHPVKFADIFYKGQDIGGMAEFHPKVLDQLGIKQKVAALEVDLRSLT